MQKIYYMALGIASFGYFTLYTDSSTFGILWKGLFSLFALIIVSDIIYYIYRIFKEHKQRVSVATDILYAINTHDEINASDSFIDMLREVTIKGAFNSFLMSNRYKLKSKMKAIDKKLMSDDKEIYLSLPSDLRKKNKVSKEVKFKVDNKELTIQDHMLNAMSMDAKEIYIKRGAVEYFLFYIFEDGSKKEIAEGPVSTYKQYYCECDEFKKRRKRLEYFQGENVGKEIKDIRLNVDSLTIKFS